MYIKTFKQITSKNVNEAGGKGASLGELTNNKIPVPPGFVILASAFDRFLKEFGSTRCKEVVKHQYGRYYDFSNPEEQKLFVEESQKSGPYSG